MRKKHTRVLPPAPVSITGHVHEHGEEPALLYAALAVNGERHLEAAGERGVLWDLLEVERPALQGVDVDDRVADHAEGGPPDGLGVDGVDVARRLLLPHLLHRGQVEHGLFLLDVVLDLVGDVLLACLQPEHLDVDLEVKVEVAEVDEVGEGEPAGPVPSLADPIEGGQHLRGDHPGAVLDEDDEVVYCSVAAGMQHLATESKDIFAVMEYVNRRKWVKRMKNRKARTWMKSALNGSDSPDMEIAPREVDACFALCGVDFPIAPSVDSRLISDAAAEYM